MSCTAFALLAPVPAPPAHRTPTYTYDRAQQLNVTADGKPVTTDPNAPAMESYTHNHKGFKKDDDWATLGGPTMTHNSSGLKKDDD